MLRDALKWSVWILYKGGAGLNRLRVVALPVKDPSKARLQSSDRNQRKRGKGKKGKEKKIACIETGTWNCNGSDKLRGYQV